jgi:hypothetical protein
MHLQKLVIFCSCSLYGDFLYFRESHSLKQFHVKASDCSWSGLLRQLCFLLSLNLIWIVSLMLEVSELNTAFCFFFSVFIINKIWNVYSFGYIDIPKAFFMPRHAGFCHTNVIKGHCCMFYRSCINVVWGNCCALGHSCCNMMQVYCVMCLKIMYLPTVKQYFNSGSQGFPLLHNSDPLNHAACLIPAGKMWQG